MHAMNGLPGLPRAPNVIDFNKTDQPYILLQELN